MKVQRSDLVGSLVLDEPRMDMGSSICKQLCPAYESLLGQDDGLSDDVSLSSSLQGSVMVECILASVPTM